MGGKEEEDGLEPELDMLDVWMDHIKALQQCAKQPMGDCGAGLS